MPTERSDRPRLVTQPSLGPWAEQWDRLGETLPLPSPFLRSWWLGATAQGRPGFLLVIEDGRLIGGLAVQHEPRAGLDVIRLMGTGVLCPDHLDRLAAPGREDAVDRALASWWKRPGSRLVDLDGVATGSQLERALP